jgi:hypothetical protein
MTYLQIAFLIALGGFWGVVIGYMWGFRYAEQLTRESFDFQMAMTRQMNSMVPGFNEPRTNVRPSGRSSLCG